MLTDEMREFLKKPLIARMTTLDSNGYPHIVPVWYLLDGDDIVVTSMQKTRKNGHIKNNAKGALTVGGQPGDGGGYLFKGDWEIEPDPDNAWLMKIAVHYEGQEQAEKDVAVWGLEVSDLLRLKVKRAIKVF